MFGWETKIWDGGEQKYWMLMTGKPDEPGGINGGLFKRPVPLTAGCGANAFVCTMVVEDYDAIAAKILAAGGKEAMPKFALVGMAWQGYFLDTEGNTFGIHQPDKNAK